jgi:GNAT superfamily N-acetyltransferase
MQATPQLDIQPVDTERFEDLAALFRTGLTRVCWDMEPRQTATEDAACRQRWRAQGISRKDGRRQAFGDLLAQGHMPGLLAYHEGQPVGWMSIGPRGDYPRIGQSRALPPLDDLAVWAIPCVYVHPAQRGQGIAVALLQAAVQHAGRRGAPAVGAIRVTRRRPFRPRRPSMARWRCSPEPASSSPGRHCQGCPRSGHLATRCGHHARRQPHEAATCLASPGQRIRAGELRVRTFSTNSRPALRAASGRPRAGSDATVTGAPASPSRREGTEAVGSMPRRPRRAAGYSRQAVTAS